MAPLEILAPAGNEEMLRAAVFSGADAVYLGLTAFNARRSAGNFTPEALARAVSFCHGRGVRVWVTLNTTLYAAELPEVARAVADVAAAGADGVIVQDLAVAALVKQMAPGLALRGSTQMSVHTLEGAKQLADMGFSCAILARELSLAEIEAITAASTIPTEVFVHGALCMSVSGQCYLSAFLGGRSGNRGSCAGPCRLPFAADGSGAAHLSLKDMSALDALPRLQAAGVGSAKIEGRLRTPEYVAAAVDACRRALAGEPYDKARLEAAFSRSGFTDGYLTGRIDGRMFGVRTAEDSAATKAALPALRELFRREMPRVPVDLVLACGADGVTLTARDDDGHTVCASRPGAPEPAQKDPMPGIEKALSRTGGTPFFVRGLTLAEGSEAPGYLPAGEWNELRRTVLEQLLTRREAPRPWPCAAPVLPAPQKHPIPPRQALWARFERAEQMPATVWTRCARVILPIAEAEQVPPDKRSAVILELPRAMFGDGEEQTARLLARWKDAGFAGVLLQNIAQLRLAKGWTMYGGFGLNITNPLAAAEYVRLGLSGMTLLPELTLPQMAAIEPGVPTMAFAYGHMPLMLTRACPLHNVHNCAGCNGQGELTDRKGRKFPVRCSGGLRGVRTVYNPVPLYMGERLGEMPVNTALAWFTLEDTPCAARVLELLAAGAPFDGEFTRGLYYKGTN